MSYQLQPFRPAGSLLNPAIQMYCAAFSEPPYERPDPAVARDSFTRHGTNPGYRGIVAVSPQGKVLGLVYGYHSRPDQFYHRHLAHHLGPALSDRWLEDCFEFVELAVAPGARGLGIGRALHDAILAGLPHKTALLTTRAMPTVALGLYERRGWQIVHPDFRMAPELPAYYIMGRDLPYTPT